MPRILRYAVVILSLAVMVGAFAMLADPGSKQSNDGRAVAAPPADSQIGTFNNVQSGKFVTEKSLYERQDFDAPVLQQLKEADVSLSESFTVVFEMRTPAVWFDPAQGTMVQECRLTYKDGIRGLSMQTINDQDGFSYVAPAADNDYKGMDYDEEQNLLIWQSMRKDCLSTSDFNRAIDEQEMFRISPIGEVSSDHVHTQVYNYRIGSEENIHEFEKFRLATGRGYSKHLRTLEEEPQETADGTLLANARGGFGARGLSGIWDLSVADDEHQLIREAFFYADVATADMPTIHVQSYGAELETGHGTIASSGTIEFDQGPGPKYVVDIVILDYRSEADEEHLAELRERLTNEIPIGAEIVDFSVPIPQRYEYDGSNLD